MGESIFKDVTLKRKEILNKVNPENVELAQSYLKYINISSFEKHTVSSKIQLLLHFLNYIHENLEDKLLTDITVAEMENYLVYLGKCGLQPNSISTKMNGLSVFYKFLINKGVTMFNPIYYIPKPHKLKTDDHRHFLTEKQVEILKEKLEENGDRTLQVYAFFSLSTGARVTAISSIRWEQIDFEKRMVYKVKEKFSNYCTLCFSEYVKDLLLKLRTEREQNKINDGGWLFYSPVKFYKDNCVEIRHVNSNTLGKWAHKVGAMCDVPELTPHDFRYSCCNMLLQKGGDIAITSLILHHKNISTTLHHYCKKDDVEFMRQYKDQFGI